MANLRSCDLSLFSAFSLILHIFFCYDYSTTSDLTVVEIGCKYCSGFTTSINFHAILTPKSDDFHVAALRPHCNTVC